MEELVNVLEDKTLYFEDELAIIRGISISVDGGEEILDFVCNFLNEMVPEEFFTYPASLSGEHHNPKENVPGGLVLHTRKVFRLALELLDINNEFSNKDRFVILTAILLHDTFRYNPHSTFRKSNDMHSMAASMVLKGYTVGNVENFSLVEEICDCIETHGGGFGDYFGHVTIPQIRTSAQRFVHECDYIASRKCVDIDLNI